MRNEYKRVSSHYFVVVRGTDGKRLLLFPKEGDEKVGELLDTSLPLKRLTRRMRDILNRSAAT